MLEINTKPVLSFSKISKSMEPLYLSTKNLLVEKIRQGELKPGDRLPSNMELADQLGINHITLAKALNLLRQEGYVESYRKRGTFIKKGFGLENLAYGANARMVGLLLDDCHADTFQADLVTSIYQSLDTAGLSLKLLAAKNNPHIQFEQVKALFTNGRTAGCIVWPVMNQEQTKELQKIKPADFPLVFLDRYQEESEFDFSGYDNFPAGKMLGDYLKSEGYSNVCVVLRSGGLSLSSVKERIAGLKTVFEERVNVYTLDDSPDIRIKNILSINEKPTVLIGINEEVAVQLHDAILEAGFKIPENVVLASFDSQGVLKNPEYDITAISLPQGAVGQRAAEILVGRLGGDTKAVYHIQSPGYLVVRSSTNIQKKAELSQRFLRKINIGLNKEMNLSGTISVNASV
jgi:DNA-binding LacI/PurR family transcriptional regulator